jgi:hypothetical protein
VTGVKKFKKIMSLLAKQAVKDGDVPKDRSVTIILTIRDD